MGDETGPKARLTSVANDLKKAPTPLDRASWLKRIRESSSAPVSQQLADKLDRASDPVTNSKRWSKRVARVADSLPDQDPDVSAKQE
jgi:hypothetical protein